LMLFLLAHMLDRFALIVLLDLTIRIDLIDLIIRICPRADHEASSATITITGIHK